MTHQTRTEQAPHVICCMECGAAGAALCDVCWDERRVEARQIRVTLQELPGDAGPRTRELRKRLERLEW